MYSKNDPGMGSFLLGFVHLFDLFLVHLHTLHQV